MNDKADYVRAQKIRLTSKHTCHWPGCVKEVPPAMWGCATHWFKLPIYLRKRIWETYVPGQEVSATPSKEYIAAAKEVQQWITQNS